MIFLLLLLVLAAVAAGVWFQGLWSAAITVVNILLAMLVATSFYEPICSALEGVAAAATYTYLLDFLVLWLLFGITFAILRTVSDLIAKKPMKFDMPVDMAGRTILAIICGWLMVCFVAFSLHMAPLNSASPLGAFASPSAKAFGPFAPDRMWLSFMHTRTSPAALGGNRFDPNADFQLRYRDRRVKYAAEGSSLRFQR